MPRGRIPKRHTTRWRAQTSVSLQGVEALPYIFGAWIQKVLRAQRLLATLPTPGASDQKLTNSLTSGDNVLRFKEGQPQVYLDVGFSHVGHGAKSQPFLGGLREAGALDAFSSPSEWSKRWPYSQGEFKEHAHKKTQTTWAKHLNVRILEFWFVTLTHISPHIYLWVHHLLIQLKITPQ